MKVIKPGKTKAPKELEVTCKKCECRFSFFEREGTYHEDQRDGDVISIKCPECRTTNWIAAELFD